MELHRKYAPILRYNKDEMFFPMRVDDMLSYSSLWAKGSSKPMVARGEVTPDILVKNGRRSTTFLRSIDAGPLTGPEVVESWGKGALEMVYRAAAKGGTTLTERLARKAYDWFSPKTSRATQMFWWNNLLGDLMEEKLLSAASNELPRLVLPDETQDSALDQYEKHSPAAAYYYRQLKDGRYLCLQYWLFYSYNNWGRAFAGMNDHEGDWEGVTLFFRLDEQDRPQEPPAFITFADHESCQTKPWNHKDVTLIGTHPVGYVAAGSHAIYPEAKTHPLMKLYSLYDYATGDGRTIDHDQWVHRIDLDSIPWLGKFKGSWGTRFWLPLEKANNMLQLLLSSGPFTAMRRLDLPPEIELPGVSAPHGPVGPHRPQYANPVAWAGLPEE